MAKRFYYECVYPCEVGYFGPDNLKWRVAPIAKMVMHSVRFYPRPSRAQELGTPEWGRQPGPHYLITERPIAKHFTHVVAKKVSRPSFDRENGRRNGRVYRKKFSKVKFVKLDQDDIDSDVKKQGLFLNWREETYDDTKKNVDPKDGLERIDLPTDVAIMDKSFPVEDGDEPIEPGFTPNEEKITRKKRNAPDK